MFITLTVEVQDTRTGQKDSWSTNRPVRTSLAHPDFLLEARQEILATLADLEKRTTAVAAVGAV